MNAVAVELAVGGCAEMVFDVARSLHVIGISGAALELMEDSAIRLAEDVGENVEPAAMCHA